jgi:hypothetical protein
MMIIIITVVVVVVAIKGEKKIDDFYSEIVSLGFLKPF